MLTVASSVKVNDAPYAHVDDAQKALVLLLELLLVKDLYRQHAVFRDAPAMTLALPARLVVWNRIGDDAHVEALVPVGVQRLLDNARGARLLAIDRGHGEGIGEACIARVSAVSVGWRVSGTYGRHRACRGHRRQ